MNTREIIIDILGKEWPLSAKNIYSIMNNEYYNSITYHTMYEIIQDLVNKKVLRKINTSYFLDSKWISEELKKFQRINKSYEENKPLKIIDKKTTQIKVHSIEELYKFIIKNIDNQFFSNNPNEFFMKCQHLWGSFYKKEDKDILKKAFSNEAKIISKNNDFLDKEISKFYKSIGTKVKLGSKVESPDTIIINDCVIQVYFPLELIKDIDRIYQGKLNLDKVRKSKRLFEDFYDIEIIIIRNENIAKQLKNEIKNYF
jgi:hypothetical protein